MKKMVAITGIILGILFVVACIIVFLFWFMFGGGSYFLANPAKPEITYNEFPICLEYEINGVHTKVEDVLICEFDGFRVNEGTGKFRKWKAHLKSGNTRITLFSDDSIEIYYFPVKEDSRLPGVFMGDTEYYSGGIGDTFPDAWYTTNYEDKTINDYIISANDMKEKYNLRLVKWECPQPIGNKFE